jgi:hypothetical protein
MPINGLIATSIAYHKNILHITGERGAFYSIPRINVIAHSCDIDFNSGAPTLIFIMSGGQEIKIYASDLLTKETPSSTAWLKFIDDWRGQFESKEKKPEVNLLDM